MKGAIGLRVRVRAVLVLVLGVRIRLRFRIRVRCHKDFCTLPNAIVTACSCEGPLAEDTWREAIVRGAATATMPTADDGMHMVHVL